MKIYIVDINEPIPVAKFNNENENIDAILSIPMNLWSWPAKGIAFQPKRIAQIREL